MKKLLTAALVLATLGLGSCSQEEVTSAYESEETQVETPNFTVLEEHEISGSDLFANAMAGMEELKGTDAYNELKSTFEKADETLSAQDPITRAISPALYKTVKITYQTTDQDNETVTASALIVYPLLKRIKNVMLINHGTQIGIAMIPTKYTSVEEIMAATGALCILPDYIGLGSTDNHPDLYLNHEVHGRTSVDALLALLDYAKAKKLWLDSNYTTSIVGYSQGGSVSLASLREVQRRDAATQKRINLKSVYCGDGPYDLRRTFETYVEDYEAGKKMGLGSVIPLVINSMFNSYPSEMADLNYEDFFTEWCLSTGVPQAIQQNDEDVIDMMIRLNGKTLGDILNMQYIEENPDDLNRLLALMDRQNLCTGWMPQYKLKLLHCNPDGVVPFSNFEEASANLNNEYLETEVVNLNTTLLSEPILQHVYGMLIMLKEVFGE